MIYDQLIQTAHDLLRAGQREQASICLHAAHRLHPGALQAHNLIEEHRLPGALGPAFGVAGRIHPGDEIYAFFANHPSSLNPPRDYLSDGWRTMLELALLCEQLQRPLSRCNSLLEFACGYGRLTRHLARVLPPSTITVSDVMPGSVDFLKTQLHVNGFDSHTDPAQLHIPSRYALIFVLSLFSHLPDGSWQAWLQKLYAALQPGGMLIISTHGQSTAREVGVTVPESGLFFVAESESRTLNPHAYGCTYTSDDYVRAAIATLQPTVAQCHFMPAHFWSRQDAWALVAPQ
jgi:SAM-dependent methyltransferase